MFSIRMLYHDLSRAAEVKVLDIWYLTPGLWLGPDLLIMPSMLMSSLRHLTTEVTAYACTEAWAQVLSERCKSGASVNRDFAHRCNKTNHLVISVFAILNLCDLGRHWPLATRQPFAIFQHPENRKILRCLSLQSLCPQVQVQQDKPGGDLHHLQTCVSCFITLQMATTQLLIILN